MILGNIFTVSAASCNTMRLLAPECMLWVLVTLFTSTSAGSLQIEVQPYQLLRPLDGQPRAAIRIKFGTVMDNHDILGLTSSPHESSNILVVPLWKSKTLLMVVASLYGLVIRCAKSCNKNYTQRLSARSSIPSQPCFSFLPS